MRIIILQKEKILLLLALFTLLGGLLFLFPLLYQAILARSRLGETTILIDPGHGGIDGGTQDYTGNLEKDINLAIARKIRAQLAQCGVQVVMTREEDTELAPYQPGRGGRHRRDLSARIERARKAKALFLVSIHCDWSTAAQRRGMVAFYYYRNPVGKNLALSIQEELNKVQPRPQKAAPGKYFILEQPGINGVIVEVGFLSNREEAALLQQPDYQEKVALAITQGILRVLPAAADRAAAAPTPPQTPPRCARL
ncbi:MAG: cell wall hydrolase [Firmicutes bacterium]|nr:cell wall hydrolase [Bacillota bacterium]